MILLAPGPFSKMTHKPMDSRTACAVRCEAVITFPSTRRICQISALIYVFYGSPNGLSRRPGDCDSDRIIRDYRLHRQLRSREIGVFSTLFGNGPESPPPLHTDRSGFVHFNFTEFNYSETRKEQSKCDKAFILFHVVRMRADRSFP